MPALPFAPSDTSNAVILSIPPFHIPRAAVSPGDAKLLAATSPQKRRPSTNVCTILSVLNKYNYYIVYISVYSSFYFNKFQQVFFLDVVFASLVATSKMPIASHRDRRGAAPRPDLVGPIASIFLLLSGQPGSHI